jgi:RsiW-degrading membrane proteinase PrsW (M82 family)
MWSKLEPVRSYLYTLLLPVIAVLVYYGLVSEQAAPLWAALATAVLGVPVVEKVRSLVRPVTKDE